MIVVKSPGWRNMVLCSTCTVRVLFFFCEIVIRALLLRSALYELLLKILEKNDLK